MRRQAVAAALSTLLTFAAFGAPAWAAEAADLSVAISGPQETPLVGESFDIIVTVKNLGTAAAEEAGLGVYLGDGVTVDGIDLTDPTDLCSEEYPGEQRCALGTIATGEVAKFTFHLTRAMARDIWIDAWVYSDTTEYDEGNYDSLEIGPDTTVQADLALTASAPEEPELDESYDTSFVVLNRGPGRAKSVSLTVSLPEGNTYVGSTSTGAGDVCTLHEETFDEEGFEGGPYVYRYVECTLGTVPFAATVTITVTQIRDNPYGTWSSGYVQTASYDYNFDNDWADIEIPGHPSVTSDLGTTVTVPEAMPLVGESYEAVFTVANGGPAAAPDAEFGTYVPYEFELGSVTSGSSGECAEDQWGGITCDLGTMDPGESETIILSLTRTKPRESWLSAWAYSTNYDPNYENDYVEKLVDADTSTPADVSVELEGPIDPEVGSTFTTTTTVTSKGPETATAVVLHQSVPEGATFVSAASSDAADVCELDEQTYDDDFDGDGAVDESYTYREVLCDLGDLANGESTQVDVSFTRDADYELWSSSWAETTSYDGKFKNDWGEWNSSGIYPDYECRAIESEGAAASPVPCEYDGEAGRGGAGRIDFSPAGSRDSTVGAGGGDDDIVVSVSGGKKGRRIVIWAGRGNDTVTVKVAPGVGNTEIVVRGGRGNDTIDIEAPRPAKGLEIIVKGGRGKDVISGSAARDLIWGGPGNDRIEGGEGNDRLAGGRGRDECIGGPGRDKLIGC